MSPQKPVIIIGAGVVGLTLAQALKQSSIPFEIYERDTFIDRAHGWGITIHWALAALKSCLPPPLFAKLATIQVDPQQGLNDTGRFLFLDLATAEPKFVIPPAERLRINRRKFRSLLAEGLDVHWGKSIKGFKAGNDGVEVEFMDGSKTTGSMLVGADGSASRTRRFLVGQDAGKLNQLPARFMGVTVRLSEEKVKPLRDIDPLLFQGCHPDTGVFLWFSTLSTPDVNGSRGSAEEYYEGQVNMSWLVKDPEDETPAGNEARLAKMKEMAKPFEKRLRASVEDIPEGTEVLEIKLQDWPTGPWPNYDGRVTLVGDACHAMTMYRGEAANHGITDAARLQTQIIDIYEGKVSQKEGVEIYETEMRARCHDAVMLSRQACLDAHDLNGLTPESPLVSKRAKVLKPGQEVQKPFFKA